MPEPLFEPYQWTTSDRDRLDQDGFLLLPGLLTPPAQTQLTAALARVNELPVTPTQPPRRYAAEHDAYLASVIAHPQMFALARTILGTNIRFDHCVDLSRAGSDPGSTWHTHPYADDQPELGFIRIFFYVNGFTAGDGGLRVVPGSHLFRHNRVQSATDEELWAGPVQDQRHPLTGEPLAIQDLQAPPGSVILLWTHALHAVSPRRPESETRWAVVYGYRNPGQPSGARWISESFEQHPPVGAEALMSVD